MDKNKSKEAKSEAEKQWPWLTAIMRKIVQFFRAQVEKNWPVLVAVGVVAGVLVIGWASYQRFFLGTVWREGTGFEGKTVWEWLELLIIPVVLALGAYYFNRQERKTDREIAKEREELERELATDRQQEANLQNYFDRMTELLQQKKGLRKSAEGDEVRAVARSRTLATLRTLDGKRKGLLVRFLYEAGLISHPAIVALDDADLSNADLFNAQLRGVSLEGVHLEGAHLPGAHLEGAHLERANLWGARLGRAHLEGAHLQTAHLEGAHLDGAYLGGAYLEGAHLNGAPLRRAHLEGAYLQRAHLQRANLQRAHLEGAHMEGALLEGTLLQQANLERANLEGTYLDEANLQGTHLRLAKGLSLEQLDSAVLDEETVLPDGQFYRQIR